MPYFAYILKSLKDGGYYFGSTANLEKRIRSHNSGKVQSTKHRRPLILHYKEEYSTKTEAIKREHFLNLLRVEFG